MTEIRRGDVRFVRRDDGTVEVWIHLPDGDSIWSGLRRGEWADVVAALTPQKIPPPRKHHVPPLTIRARSDKLTPRTIADGSRGMQRG